MSYASRARPPRTLTAAESAALLRVSGAAAGTFRDHMLFALALGTGLREAELVALDMADVTNRAGGARSRIALRVFKRCGGASVPQEVFVGDGLRHKLSRLFGWKKRHGEPLGPDAPLFMARGRRRLSTRRVREIFAAWAELSDLSSGLTFHALRHTFLQRLYESTRDIRLVQRAARHANLTTTTIYAGASADDVSQAVQDLDRG